MDSKRVFKIFFTTDDIRRISLDVSSWEVFLRSFQAIYHPNLFHVEKLIQYIDEEGDKCTLSCEKEFSAMLESFTTSTVIRLYVSEGKNYPQYFRDGPEAEFRRMYISKKNAKEEEIDSSSGAEFKNKIEAIIRKISQQDKILPFNLPSCIAPFVKIIPVNDVQTNVDVDVDVTNLLESLHKASYELIGTGSKENLQQAKIYLQCLLTITPTHCVSLYNMACTEALLGETDSANNYLEQAIQAGYRDIQHIRTDPDLVSLRSTEAYKKTLVNLLKLRLNYPVQDEQSAEKKEEVQEVPVVKQEVPAVKEEVPVVKQEVPVVKQEVPVVQQEVPVVQQEVPVVKQEVPVVKQEVPIVKQEVPIVKEPEVVCNYPEELKTMLSMGFDKSKSAQMLDVMRGDLPRSIEAMFS